MTISDGKERFYHHRRLGKSDIRRDGSRYNPEDDDRGYSFEQFAANYFGCEADDDLYENGDGDHGIDVVKNNVIIGCYCAGITERKDGSPARLIKNLYDKEPHIHVVGVGTKETGFEFIGWITHSALRARFNDPEKRDPPLHGNYKLTCPFNELWSMDILDHLLEEDNALDILNELNECN